MKLLILIPVGSKNNYSKPKSLDCGVSPAGIEGGGSNGSNYYDLFLVVANLLKKMSEKKIEIKTKIRFQEN